MFKFNLLDGLANFIVRFISMVNARNEFHFSLLLTVVFYYPALKSGSIDAGFIYMGDNIGYYLPALAKAYSLISSYNFFALDFSSYNASSEFFLTSNFYAVHPFVVLYSLLMPSSMVDMDELTVFFVLMLATHSFLACYFTTKLFRCFFGFTFLEAALVASIFAFSGYMVAALGEPVYLFSLCVFPWAAYAALKYQENGKVKCLLLASLPVVLGILGGYLPLGITGVGLSLMLAWTWCLNEESLDFRCKIKKMILVAMPSLLAFLILSPYLASVYVFLTNSPSASTPSLFFSAHQLSELPHTVIRAVSSWYSVPGPFYEFSVYWGLIPTCVTVIFFFSQNASKELSPQNWGLFKLSITVYALAVFSIFGEFSVISDLIYYFVPQIGKMHIYQRFLLPIFLFFAVATVLMLKAVVEGRPHKIIKIVLSIVLSLLVSSSFSVGFYPDWAASVGLNDYVVFELILAVCFLFSLMIPGKKFVYWSAIILLALPTLNKMYDYSNGQNRFSEQSKRLALALDKNERKRLMDFLRQNSKKDIIKYVDLTPRWNSQGYESFPKSLPYFVINELSLSSYTGFNFYLAVRKDYQNRMPIIGSRVVLGPDWGVAKRTGVDFIAVLESDVGNVIPKEFFESDKSKWLRLKNGVIVLPVKAEGGDARVLMDNGYFKVYNHKLKAYKDMTNIALGASALQMSSAGGGAHLAVDGNRSGTFSEGSVTHTAMGKNAWLDLDLGSINSIGGLRIWPRTDCCKNRISSYWLFISKTPFNQSDTPPVLSKRSSVWSMHVDYGTIAGEFFETGGVEGQYVRVQLSDSIPLTESYLSVAEVEVYKGEGGKSEMIASSLANESFKIIDFHTNKANYLRLELNSSTSLGLEYLFWNNPRLKYYVNSEPAELVQRGGLAVINLPPGRNVVEVKYRHWPLLFFWVIYALYGLTIIAILCRSVFLVVQLVLRGQKVEL